MKKMNKILFVIFSVLVLLFVLQKGWSMNVSDLSTTHSANKNTASLLSVHTIKNKQNQSSNSQLIEKKMNEDEKINVLGSQDAFPDDVDLAVTDVPKNQVLDSIRKLDNKVAAKQVVAYDFNFHTNEANHLEPKENVLVTITNPAFKQATRLTAYHLSNRNGKAETAQIISHNSKTGQVTIQANEFSIYAIVTELDAQTDGKIWLNTNEDTLYQTLNAAVTAAVAGDVIHIQGNFKNDALAEGVVIAKAITLDIAGDTTITGSLTDTNYNTSATNVFDGILLKSTAKLQTSNQATLTMKYFNRALAFRDNAQISDGHYTLSKNRMGLDYGSAKTLEGSTDDRQSLVIESTDSASPFNYNSKLIKNATVNIEAVNDANGYGRTGSGTWNLENVKYTTKNMWYSVGAYQIKQSDFLYVSPAKFSTNQGVTFNGPFTIEDSNVTFDGNGRYMFSALISHSSSAAQIGTPSRIIRSTFNLQNAKGRGGYNLAKASVDVIDSTINVNNAGSAAMGANYMSYDTTNTIRFKFSGDSVYNTAMSSPGDSIGANPGTTNPTIVVGGAYKWVWNVNNPSVGNTPTNGSENGNERLTLFTLKDASINQLTLPNAENTATYTYNVAKATNDGKKRVWTPAAKVKVTLNNSDATFADGSTADKTLRTIRNYHLSDVEGNTTLGTPVDANGVAFLGWFYKDSQGVEHAFNEADAITQDLNVYAKWDSKMVVYHNNATDDQTYLSAIDQTATNASVVDYHTIVEQKAGFKVPGKIFKYWTTDPAGQTAPIQPAETVNFTEGQSQIDLYAQYDLEYYTVKFSANGGVFSTDSIFRTNPTIFDIQVDSNKGEVAVLKQKATYNQAFRELLGGLDHNQLTPTNAKATKFVQKLYGVENYWTGVINYYWYKQPNRTDSIRFDDYTDIFGQVEGENPAITADTTYYLGWQADSAIPTETTTTQLPADLYGKEIQASSQVEMVNHEDDAQLNAKLDLTNLVNELLALKDKYPDKADQDILIQASNFKYTVKLTIPSKFQAPSSDKIKVSGLNAAFESTTTMNGNEVLVNITMNPAITNYAELKERIQPSTTTEATASVNPLTALTRLFQPSTVHAVDNQSNELAISVDGLMLVDGKTNGENISATLDITGTPSLIVGTNSAATNYRFSLTPTQDPSGADASSTATASVSYTYNTPISVSLLGDMSVGQVKEDNSVDYETNKIQSVYLDETEGALINYQGTLNVEWIKTEINDLKEGYVHDHGDNEAAVNNLYTSQVDSSFITTFKLADGLILPAESELKTIQLQGADDLFYIADVTRASDTEAVITMKLKKNQNGGSYTKFVDLHRDVSAANDTLSVVIPKVKVPSKLVSNRQYTTSGKVVGYFIGHSYTLNPDQTEEKYEDFNYEWDSLQNSEGKDEASNDESTIQATIRPVAPVKGNLLGDILIGTDTGYDKVKLVHPDESLTYTGRLASQTIKDQITRLAEKYPGDLSTIALSDVQSTFTAIFNVPDGLILPENVNATLDSAINNDESNQLFRITNVEKVSEQSVKVTMKLVKNYTKFTDLYYDVLHVTPSLEVRIANIQVPANAAYGQRYQVNGKVVGNFTGKASGDSGTSDFNFNWPAIQDPAGRDVVLKNQTYTDPKDVPIQYTVEVARKIDVQKIWSKVNSQAGALAQFNLYRVGSNNEKTFISTLLLDGKVDEEGTEKTPWQGSFENLPATDDLGQSYHYVVEEAVPSDAAYDIAVKRYAQDGQEVAANTDATNATVAKFVFNNIDKITLPVTKIWQGGVAEDATVKIYRTLETDASATAAPTDATLANPVANRLLTANEATNEPDTSKVLVATIGKNATIKWNTTNSTKWTANVSNLPVASADGKKYSYSIEEEVIDGYRSVIAPDTASITPMEVTASQLAEGFTVTNIANRIKMTKKWLGTPADSVTLQLLEGQTVKGTVTLTSENALNNQADTWQGYIDNVPVVDENNQPMNYTVKEVVDGDYQTQVTGNAKEGYVVQNTEVYRQIPVKKVWHGTALSSVSVQLLANNQATAKVVTLNEENNWQAKFENVPKVDAAGQTISYSVKETLATPDNYRSEITGSATAGFVITNTEQKAITVHKTWLGGDGQLAKVYLKDGVHDALTATLTAANNWQHTFKVDKYNAQDQEINYSVTEDQVSGYAEPIIESTTAGFEVTNIKLMNLPVEKVWRGKIGPAVTVKLLANQAATTKQLTLSADNDWQASFTELPTYDRQTKQAITYTVTEVTPAGYQSTITGSQTSGYKVTNTQVMTIPVKKVWVGDAASEVTLQLYANNQATNQQITLTAEDNWQGNFANLPTVDEQNEPITYDVQEVALTGYRTEKTGSAKTGFTFTNTQLVDVAVHKQWLDAEGNTLSTPPTSAITAQLLKDNQVVATKELSATNNWQATFSGVVKTDLEANKYTVQEQTVPTNYTATTSYSKANGFTITNQQTTQSITVEKIWQDETGNAIPAPMSATVYLTADGVKVSGPIDLTLNQASHTFTNLPIKNGNQTIKYGIEEESLDGYVTTVQQTQNHFVVTNKQAETTSVQVTKLWKDETGTTLAADKVKDLKATVYLLSSVDNSTPEVVATQDITATNNWRYTFTGLPLKDEAGKAITYTVKEEAITGYTSAVTGDVTNGFVITNTETAKEQPVNIQVIKRWVGQEGGNVTVHLYANGTDTGKKLVLIKEANWQGSFSDLPAKDEAGKAITYTVKEEAITGYTSAVTGDVTNGFVITNTEKAKEQPVNIQVTKRWVGQEGGNVTVHLYANG
ncbi:Cna B-type domain-containing protein, partial [Enterococcus columbae]|uniref:Cna B-type domain-containing protein n=1 Tax=Enterococcus columbae TaxID=1355 RepID=UPI0009004C10